MPSDRIANIENNVTFSTRQQALALLAFLVAVFAVALAGSAVTTSQIQGWYAELNKPSWTPPNWIFGPVWTILYAAMGVAAWLVWRRSGWRRARGALAIFAVQLALNCLWSFIFFGWETPSVAAVEIVLLWLAIAATIRAFARHSTVAAWLLAPYLAWVSFAAALNIAIWWLQNGGLS